MGVSPGEDGFPLRGRRSLAAIEFTPDLHTGIREVDEQHTHLVALFNHLDESFRKGSANREMGEILARLFRYAKTHFHAEESLMERANYDGLPAHRHEHEQFVQHLRKFIIRYKRNEERISNEVLVFLRHWITHHILENDLAFAEPVKAALAASEEAQPSAG